MWMSSRTQALCMSPQPFSGLAPPQQFCFPDSDAASRRDHPSLAVSLWDRENISGSPADLPPGLAAHVPILEPLAGERNGLAIFDFGRSPGWNER